MKIPKMVTAMVHIDEDLISEAARTDWLQRF